MEDGASKGGSGNGNSRRQSRISFLLPGEANRPDSTRTLLEPPIPLQDIIPSSSRPNSAQNSIYQRYHDDPALASRRTSRSSGISSTAWEHGVWDIYDASPVNRQYEDDDNLIIWPHEKEDDDELHEPEKERWRFILCSKRGLINFAGLALIIFGILGVFIVWPVLATRHRNRSDGLSDAARGCLKDPDCIAHDRPLLKNVRTGLIDPDTPSDAMEKKSHDGKKMKLVFSDEFNKPNRTFFPGDDPYFTGADLWYGATEDMEYYSPLALSTSDGHLTITFSAYQNHGLNYLSGMLQSWNQLCIKGGRLEASISLPGSGAVEGLWPGFWAMGNLGRPGYLATTEGLWPYSYVDVCDSGITPNQSDSSGLSFLPGMRLPACSCADTDHPTPGRSRSAPEMDALEGSVDYRGRRRGKKAPPGNLNGATGTASQSFQAAPFDLDYTPNYDFFTVYNRNDTVINDYKGGPFQQANSAVTWLNNSNYEAGGGGFETYGFEYTPGTGKEGKAAWFVGDEYTFSLDGRSLGPVPQSDISARPLPLEPMSIVLNLGMSLSFSEVYLAELNKLFPATMRVNYIRAYQEEGKESVTCDPKGWETTQYIREHPKAYQDPEMVFWKDTGYEWPENTLMSGCDLDPRAKDRSGG